jgi:hypothetical protein
MRATFWHITSPDQVPVGLPVHGLRNTIKIPAVPIASNVCLFPGGGEEEGVALRTEQRVLHF